MGNSTSTQALLPKCHITCLPPCLVSIRSSPYAWLSATANLYALHIFEKREIVHSYPTQGRDKTSTLPMPWAATRKSSRCLFRHISSAICSYLYQNTISRFSSGMGVVGKHEAKASHFRAYGGLVSLLPSILSNLAFFISRYRARSRTCYLKK